MHVGRATHAAQQAAGGSLVVCRIFVPTDQPARTVALHGRGVAEPRPQATPSERVRRVATMRGVFKPFRAVLPHIVSLQWSFPHSGTKSDILGTASGKIRAASYLWRVL
jgi:hypothetical protein